MRRCVSGLFLIGVIVMVVFGRVTWLSGGGVVMPQVSARHGIGPAGPALRLTNTGQEPLKRIEIGYDRWNLDRREKVCADLAPGQEVIVPLPPEAIGNTVYLFADRYPLPAWFEIPDLPAR